jgi:hypothetical protein
MIQQIIDDMGFNEQTNVKKTPAAITVKLGRDPNGKPYEEKWSYRSIVGKLNFLEKSTRPDLSYAVHQCARFSAEPKESHATAVKHIVKYLLATKDKGIILKPSVHSLDCFVDADFVGNWNRTTAHVDPATAKSRTGFIIFYASCPLTWASKLQKEVALSTTEAEYNALSESLRSVINLTQILQESKQVLGWEVDKGRPKVHCSVFEDNSGALEMARIPKMRPRTKHMAVRLHHFREHVRKGEITLHKVESRYQLADIATKPQPVDLFESQRESIMQWESELKTKDELQETAKHLRACEIIGKIMRDQPARSHDGVDPSASTSPTDKHTKDNGSGTKSRGDGTPSAISDARKRSKPLSRSSLATKLRS